MAAFATDLGQRLQASWARRGEAVAALRSSAAGVGPRLHALWLGRRQLPDALRAWVSSSNSPFVRRAFATRTMSIAAIAVGVIVVARHSGPGDRGAGALPGQFDRQTISGRDRIPVAGHGPCRVASVAVADGDDRQHRRAWMARRFATADALATAEGIRLQLSLWSLVARRPQLAELAITRPMFQVPLLRERTAPAPAPAAPATAGARHVCRKS